MKFCSIEGCGREHNSRGWCKVHYSRWQRLGTTSLPPNTSLGVTKHPLYGAWAAMLNRCSNPNNSSYSRYGARGITVCERWLVFRNFLADMGERPDGMTLDRINPDGPYSPENCRWATLRDQRNNISDDGRERMRVICAEKRRQYWENRRANGFVKKPKHNYVAHGVVTKACVVCGSDFSCIRSNATCCSRKCRELYRPRYRPEHMADAKAALE